jgi:hypothetical protein
MDYNEALKETSEAPDAPPLDAALLLRPLLRDSLAPITAAVSIQAAWRARVARCRLTPSVVWRAVRRRAAVALQRAFRTHLVSSLSSHSCLLSEALELKRDNPRVSHSCDNGARCWRR